MRKLIAYSLCFVLTGCASLATQMKTQLDIHPMALQTELVNGISPNQFRQAEQADELILSEYTIVTTDRLYSRVYPLVLQLIEVSHNPTMTPVVRILEDESLNAFVTGGAFIYVNTGLIQESESDDILAGVLAHELAHLNAGHNPRSQRRSLWTNLAALVAGRVAQSDSAKEVINTVRALAEPAYSREHEREADVLGVIYAHRAGFNSSALASFFIKTAQYEKEMQLKAEQALKESYYAAQDICRRSGTTSEKCKKYSQAYTEKKQRYESMELARSPLFRSHPIDSERIELIHSLHAYLNNEGPIPQNPTAQKVLSVLDFLESDKPVLKEAIKLHNEGYLDQAERLYLDVLKTDPTQSQAAFNLGDLYANKGWIQAAIENYEYGLKYEDRSDIRIKIDELYKKLRSPSHNIR